MAPRNIRKEQRDAKINANETEQAAAYRRRHKPKAYSITDREKAIENLKSGNSLKVASAKSGLTKKDGGHITNAPKGKSTMDKIKDLDAKKKPKSLGRSSEKEMLDSMNSMRPNNEDMYPEHNKSKK